MRVVVIILGLFFFGSILANIDGPIATIMTAVLLAWVVGGLVDGWRNRRP